MLKKQNTYQIHVRESGLIQLRYSPMGELLKKPFKLLGLATQVSLYKCNKP
jgi:hypothetical protein